MKQYLAVREQNEMYESVRRAGGIGIPYFELEDGTGTLDLNEFWRGYKTGFAFRCKAVSRTGTGWGSGRRDYGII